MSLIKSYGEIVGLSHIQTDTSLYEFNKVIHNLIDYEYNLVKFILECIFTRYCNIEKLYYINRRDLVLFITGLNCDDLVSYNSIGYVSEDPLKIKQIHLTFNDNYYYIIDRLKYMIERNVKLKFYERYNNKDTNIYPAMENAIINDTKHSIFKMYRNRFTIKMPDKDYLYKPTDIHLLIPIIQKWYKEQFPDKNNLVINTISKKILECLK